MKNMHMKPLLFCVGLFLAAIAPCRSQETTPQDESATINMDTVVVTGTQPGPGLWKVSKDEHVLWILGTVSPSLSGVQWKADEVRGVLEQADQVLGAPGVALDADVGFFRGLTLLPSMMKAVKNPDGKTLNEVLPPAVYARWAALKQRHVGRNNDIEKKRPFFAAGELQSAAFKKSGLGGKMVGPVMDEVMKRRKLKITPTTLKITINDPKAAIADFRNEASSEAEITCLEETMTRLEHDLPRMVERANAWAVGDVDALRALPLTDQESCKLAWSESATARKHGMADISAQVSAKWLEVAQAALEKNHATFATLPIDMLLSSNGVLVQLQARGYEVQAPE
jgi:uncharacterized protein YbaP (TraB family)